MTPLFAQVLGAERFARLPAPIRRFHDVGSTRTFAGSADIERGAGASAHLAAWLANFPRAASAQPFALEVAASVDGETWTRRFGSHVVQSRLSREGNLLVEQFGLLRCVFALVDVEAGLDWQLVRVSSCGVRLPLRCFSGIAPRERVHDNGYRFDVDIRMPLLGRLVRYRGHLDVD